MLFDAKVASFGCGSKEEIAELQHIRPNNAEFQKKLYEQIFLGQCVEISKGTVVEGIADEANPSMLLVDRQIQPPGYLAPPDDFEIKRSAEGK